MPKFFSYMFLLVMLINVELWANPPEEEATTPVNPPVVVVNGKTLTQQDYNDYLKARMEQTSVRQAPERGVIIKELINRQLVVQDALKKQLDKTPSFKKRLENQRESLLAAIGMQDYLDKNPLSEELLKAEYDKRIQQMNLPKEYKVKHILVQTEEEATAIISALNNAESFTKLAKEKSIDTTSVEKGGDLGWVLEQQVVPTFAAEMVKLKKGEYTKSPVQSQFGWHVIALEDIRDATPPPFENVKQNLEMALQTQKMQEYVDKLREEAQITFPDDKEIEKVSPPNTVEKIDSKQSVPASESNHEQQIVP